MVRPRGFNPMPEAAFSASTSANFIVYSPIISPSNVRLQANMVVNSFLFQNMKPCTNGVWEGSVFPRGGGGHLGI